jgi:hypothetical protein
MKMCTLNVKMNLGSLIGWMLEEIMVVQGLQVFPTEYCNELSICFLNR